MKTGLAGLAVALAGLMTLAASARAQNDLRQFRVGMSVRELPAAGYDDFTCADSPAVRLTGWGEYAKCPKDTLGLHAVSFRYEESSNPLANVTDEVHGTRVAGHPVLISLLIDDHKEVRGLRIITDPKAYLYMHKKAFLFADQVRAHYGTDGWRCADAKPGGNQAPIGSVFIDRTCVKSTAAREITVVQQLFRHADEPLENFVSATEVTILAR